MADSMVMTRSEAMTFLSDVLKLSTTSFDNGEPTLVLLNLILKQFKGVIPFQSVSCCAVPRNQRHLPTWSEIRRDMFEKRGGLCYPIHVFMKELLSALSYNVFYVSGEWKESADHLSLVVQDVTNFGSKHLVEVANGFPVFQAIPLDFETESPEYVLGFLRQKFVRNQTGSIYWYHDRAPFPGCENTSDGNWYKFLTIDVTKPRDLAFFERRMTEWYTVEQNNPLLKAPRAVTFKHEKLLAIKDDELLWESTEKQLKKEAITNFQQLLQKYNALFPQFPRQMIEDAVKFSSSSFSR